MIHKKNIGIHFLELAPKVDLHLPTPELNFGCLAKSRSVNRLYAHDTKQDNQHILCNTNVYYEASKVVNKLQLQRVIDIGCGSGNQLVENFKNIETYGIDLECVVQQTHRQYPNRRWLTCNFSSLLSIESVFGQFLDDKPQLLILANVLECIPDPRNLLSILRSLLQNNSNNRLIISTPARDKISDSLDMPSDDSHIREWTLQEFVSFIVSSGFKLEKCGYVADAETSYIELSCTSNYFSDFLIKNKLPEQSSSILLTTEYGNAELNNSIAIYAQEFEKRCSIPPIIIFLGNTSVIETSSLPGYVIIFNKFFDSLEKIDVCNLNNFSELAWRLVEQLLFYYDSISKIIYQDYLGIGATVAQAKKGYLISDRVQTKLIAHGTLAYQEHVEQSWFGLDKQELMLKEKIALENSDIVSLATEELYKTYLDFGYVIPSESVIIKECSFTLDASIVPLEKCTAINTFSSQHMLSKYPVLSSDLVSVVIPCFNTELSYVKDVIYGLNNQTLLPKELIFINDCSRENYSTELTELLQQYSHIPFRIVEHEINLGLAAARNTGIANVKTKYLVTHDSDDILLNNFIYDSVAYLERHLDVFGVSFFIRSFADGNVWQANDLENTGLYLPVGQSHSIGFIKNLFGTANATFRTKDLEMIGGWDAQDKSMWEDWAFYLKAFCYKAKSTVIPKLGYLYRVRPGSMLQTYNVYRAEQRLARNFSAVSRFDAFRIQGLLRNLVIKDNELYQVKAELSYAKQSLQQTQQQLNSLGLRIAIRLSAYLNKLPLFKKMIKDSLLFSRKIYTSLKFYFNVKT